MQSSIARITALGLNDRHHTSFLLCGLAVLAMSASAPGQDFTYSVKLLPIVPDSRSTVALGLNNGAEVVGLTTFSGNPFFVRGWRWSESKGLVMLPPPPPPHDELRYAARDISDTGFIAGDGGGETGPAWRYKDGAYLTIDASPKARAADVNNAGDVGGDNGDPFLGQFLFRYTDTRGLEFPLPDRALGGGLNEAGVMVGAMVGTFGPIVRIHPDGTIDQINGLSGFTSHLAADITDDGMIVGEARKADFSAAFRYTDQLGMRQIPSVSTWNWAVGVADDGTVAGSSRDSSRAWIWTAQRGVEKLIDLVDRSQGIVSVTQVFDINNRGQMVANVSTDNPLEGARMALLTPVNMDPNPVLAQTRLRVGRAAEFVASGAVSGELVHFLYSLRGIGAGSCPPVLGGLCLDLLDPITVIGNARADGNGTARLEVTIPGGAPVGQAVHTQAVIRRGSGGADSVKSNTLSEMIRN